MNETLKSTFSGVLSLTTLFLTAFLWQQPILLAVLLFAVGITMMLLENHRSVILIYTVAFFFGPLAEALVIYFDAWGYTSPHLLGFPLWLPFIWGNTALFLNRLNIHIRYTLQRSKKLAEEEHVQE